MSAFKIRLLSVLILTSLLMLPTASPAQAEGLIIYVKQDATGLNNGTSWIDAYTDLQLALAAPPDGAEIWVAQGIYEPTTGLDRTATFRIGPVLRLYGGFRGTETSIAQRQLSLDSRGQGANITVLSGDIGMAEVGSDNVYHVVSVERSARLDGFTITGGYADGAYPNYSGGGLLLEASIGGSIELTNVNFTHNQATMGGGLFASGGDVVLERVTFAGNTAASGGGLAVINDALTSLTDVFFRDNTAPGGYGGGVYLGGGNAMFDSTTFENNSARSGGATYNLASLIMGNVTLSANQATADFGGAIYNQGTARIFYSTFSGNSAAGLKGTGVYNSGGQLEIRNTILANSLSGPDCYNNVGTFTGDHNLIESHYACGSPLLTSDPELYPLGSYGGFTPTMALAPGSPALDIADRTSCMTTDQRGVERPQRNICDLGAYESLAPLQPGLYDDMDLAWTYVGQWTTYRAKGPYKTSVHDSRTQGDFGEVTFLGARLKLIYVKAPDRGQIDVYIDGNKVDAIDAYSPGLVWQASWTSKLLAPGVHTVRFQNPGSGSMAIDALQIYGPVPVYAGLYDDRNSNWIFAGTWTTYDGAGPFNDTLHLANSVGSEARLTFYGSKFTLTYVTANNRGLIDVYVDGLRIQTLNAKTANLAWKVKWTSPSFLWGLHTVRFVHAGGGNYIDVDAIEIFNPADATPPAAINDLAVITGTTNAGTLTLHWTAVGDDGTRGTASSYLVRYSTSAITTETDWLNASVITSGIPTPQAAGQVEGMSVSGLEPGLRYHFAVRARDEEPNLGDLSNPASAIAYNPPPVPAGIYDDPHGNWAYSGTWISYNNVSGSFNNSLHSASTVGSQAQFTFEGNKFTLTYVKASDRGLIDVYVDGSLIDTINARSSSTAWKQTWSSPLLHSAGIHTVRLVHAGGGTYIDVDAIQTYVPLDTAVPAQIIDLSATMGPSAGSVTLRWTAVGDDGTSGTASSYLVRYSTVEITGLNWDDATPVTSGIPTPSVAGSSESMTVSGLMPGRVYYFTVRALDEDLNMGSLAYPCPFSAARSAEPVAAGSYDDLDGNWFYSGTWTIYNNLAGSFNNSLHSTTAVGSEAQITFNGSQFTLTYVAANDRGLIDVYVDGIKIDTIDARSPTTVWKASWTSPVLVPGTHTVRFVHAGSGTYVDIDAITILP